MNYLVLGSAGQIGSHLTDYLSANGHKVFTFDIVQNKEQDLRIQNNLDLIEKIKQSDLVFFLAFDVGGSTYLKKYQKTFNFVANNALLMQYTFQLLEEFNKPFIFASSQMSNMSDSPYGSLKRTGEFYTKSLRGVVVKFWNVYGIEHDPEKTHVITDFINMAFVKKEIKMLTDGNEERQFLHADDCSRCLYELSKKYLTIINKDYQLHITSFDWHSIYRIAEIVSKLAGGVEIVRNRSKDSIQTIKNEPSREILNFWKPKISLEDGIKDIAKKMNLL